MSAWSVSYTHLDVYKRQPLHKALREALANALIHADSYDRRGLVIQKWSDKIRIANPGAFRINVQEALVGGVSDPRNESDVYKRQL